MRRRSKYRLPAACGAALVWAGAGVARAQLSQPLVYIQVLASTSPSGPYTSALSGLTGNQTIYFEVTDVLAPIGAVNGVNTITSESPSADGVNELAYNLTSTAGATFTGASLPTSPLNWSAGLLAQPYSTLTPSALTDGSPGLKSIPAIYDGAIAGGPLDIMETGNMTFVGGNATVTAAYNSSAAISINGGSHMAAPSSYLSYGNSLLLSSASTLAWSGQSNMSWTGASNFGGSTYTDGGVTPVSFGNSVTTSVVNIPSGGVTPFSVTFNNSSVAYLVSGGDSSGIEGTAPVTLNGAGSVSFTTANTYSGATTINAGTLRANNGSSGSATGTGNIYITGGTLGGNGGVTGTVDVNSGNITAGADTTHAGSLTTGQEFWNGGAAYVWKVNNLPSPSPGTAGTNWDLLTMSALLLPTSPASKFTIALQSAGGVTPTLGMRAANLGTGVYEIASITSFTNIPGLTGNSTTPVILTGTNGVDNSLFQLDTSNFANDTSGSSDGSIYLEFIGSGTGYAGSLDLVYNATPEPGTGMLLLAALSPMLLRRRRSPDLAHRSSAG